mgnify:CR=1 FL=1
MDSPERKFERLSTEARDDPNILAFFLTGSRGKGRSTPHSDWDIRIIVKDKVLVRYQRKYDTLEDKDFDIGVFSLGQLKAYAEWGSGEEWDRYDFTHVKVIIDKTNGEIQAIVDEKGKIPNPQIKEFVSREISAYINAVFRSVKCFRDGEDMGAHLEAALSIQHLINILFALHEGRIRPYYKYWEWELKHHPLEKIPLSARELKNDVKRILRNGDLQTQQKIFLVVEILIKKEGYQYTLDEWDKKVFLFIKTFSKN